MAGMKENAFFFLIVVHLHSESSYFDASLFKHK